MKIFTLRVESGHTLYVGRIQESDIVPTDEYTHIYEVRNFNEKGIVFMHLAKGYNKDLDGKDTKQVHVFYPNGKMWSSYGTTLAGAIVGAIKDGWMYTK